MDLDGFIRLNDAQRANAQAQAGIAVQLADIPGKMASVQQTLASADSTEADIPDKLARADLTEAQAASQRLKNVALFLGIKWDAQAHENLLKMRNMALQKERAIENESARFKSALLHVNNLMSGEGDWDSVRNGWLGFEYLRAHLPFGVALKAASAAILSGAYDPGEWRHPTHAVPGTLQSHDPGSLMQWARQTTCYPARGGAAWNWMAGFLQGLSDAAGAAAAEIQGRIDAASKAALELEQQDWSRLQKPAGQP